MARNRDPKPRKRTPMYPKPSRCAHSRIHVGEQFQVDDFSDEVINDSTFNSLAIERSR